MASDDTSKTEKATPARKKKAREDGQFARARDAGGIAATVAVVFVLGVSMSSIANRLGEFAMRCFSEPFDFLRGAEGDLGARMIRTLGWIVIPSMTAAVIGALVIGFAEAGWHPFLKLVMPRWNRLDPIAKMKQQFSFGHISTELVFNTLRVVIIGYVAYTTIRDAFPFLVRFTSAGVVAAGEGVYQVVGRLAVRACLTFVILAVADYVQSYFKIDKQLMMSRHDVKEEMRQQEGDGKVKHRMRAIARERIRRGISKALSTADVVVTNPTHVSVALRYRPEEGAPIVVAKGYDEIAMHIREVAKEKGVFIMRVPPLARALAGRVRVGRRIPVDLYGAVAEVLAFVYRLRAQKKKNAA